MLASSSAATASSAGSSRTAGSTRVPLRSKKTHIPRIVSGDDRDRGPPRPARPARASATPYRLPPRPAARDDRAVGPALRPGVPLLDGPAHGGRLHRARRDQRDPARAPATATAAGARSRRVATELGIVGPFTSEGEDWRRQRRLAVTALNTNHLRRYFDIIALATERLHTRAWSAQPETAILDDFMSYSVDVTSALAFGHDLNTLERGDGELQGTSPASSSCSPAGSSPRSRTGGSSSRPPTAPPSTSLDVLREQIAGLHRRGPRPHGRTARARRSARELPREHARGARVQRRTT